MIRKRPTDLLAHALLDLPVVRNLLFSAFLSPSQRLCCKVLFHLMLTCNMVSSHFRCRAISGGRKKAYESLTKVRVKGVESLFDSGAGELQGTKTEIPQATGRTSLQTLSFSFWGVVLPNGTHVEDPALEK
jgi:hypothetical protein